MRREELWVWGGTVLLGSNRWIEDAAVGIVDGQITFVGKKTEAHPGPGAERLDAQGCLVLPGLVNGHTHTGMSLLRGYADDLPLEDWLNKAIFPAERKWSSPEFVYWGTLLACAEMIRSGTTAFNDMYYHEAWAAKAAHEAGLRMMAGQALTEASDVDSTGADLVRSFDTFRAAVADYPLVVPVLSPHAIYTVRESSWRKVQKYASRHSVGVHFHLSEVKSETDYAMREYGKTPVQFFEGLGFWELPVTVAHAVCLTAEDIQTLGGYSVGVVHNPQSNMKVGTGIAPVVELRQSGARVALGTDSTVSNNNLDLLEEADLAAKLQAHRVGPGALKVGEVFSMLTEEGARAIRLPGKVGRLAPGYAGDLIALEVTSPHAVPLYNPYSHLIYSAGGQDVRHTVVNGRVLMKDRRLLTLDESEILREAVSWARRIMA